MLAKQLMKTLIQWTATALLGFGFSITGHAAITGQWGFADGDLFLSPIIGLPMDFLDSDTSFDTEFGTTGMGNFADVPDINDEEAKPLKYPATSVTGGYVVPHGAEPNGGGSSINQYTIIMDVLFPAASSGRRRALIQTDGGGNAEFFIDANNRLGTDGGAFHGDVTPDTWHRIAIAVDLAAAPPVISKFIDGVKVGEENPAGGIDSRLAMVIFYLFNDDDGETAVTYLNSLQFRDEKLPDGLITALGGPTAAGILTGPPPSPYVTFVAPSPESARIPQRSDVSPQPLIQAIIVDGTNAVNESMITLLLDEVPVPATISRLGETTTVTYLPSALLPAESLHTVRVNYPGQDGTDYSRQWQFFVAPYIGLEANAAAPLGSAQNPGFLVRTVQAPLDTGILNPNTLTRAIKQLNGTLTDTGGVLVANVATPGPNPDGTHNIDLINFHLDGSAYAVFPDDTLFPGIPGLDGGPNNFSTEVLAFLELPAGVHRLGVAVNTDRTDTETDDGYTLFIGQDARDFLAPVVGSFFRGSVPGFSSAFTTNEFTVVAPVEGIYSVRLVFYQTRNDAALEFYTVDSATGEKILVNTGDPRAIKAYRTSTAPFSNKPYLAEISPAPGVAGVSPLLPIEILLLDGQTQVDTGSIQLSFDGMPVVPTVNKDGRRTTIFYQPNATRSEATNNLRLVYQDTSSPTPFSFTNEWSFTSIPGEGPSAEVTGQWDFEFCDLSATIGRPLQYFDGPTGVTATQTRFGTCTELGVSLISGEEARIMEVPAGTGPGSRNLGYIMEHLIPPNGGGTRVNQYTLIMDVMVDDMGPGAAALLQISSPDNTDDGDLFWQGNQFGQGDQGYNGTGAFTPLVWHRVIAAYDEAANPPVVTKYVDGIKQDDWTANQGLDNPRRALLPTAILFADGDQDERRRMWVNSIQIRAGKLSDAEMAALGAPAAGGIPEIIPPTSVTGQWDFDQGNLNATVGKALQYFDGPEGQTASGTQFGTCSSLGVPLINGVDALIMRVPGETGPGSRNLGYIMEHLIPPNGGGTRVNQYTLIMDVMVSEAGAGAAALLQISSPDNTDDGDLFWQGNQFGQGAEGYNGTGAFTPTNWHRVIAAYDEAANPPVVTKYVDGIKQDDWTANQGLDNPRRALLPTAILFADGDQDERRVMWVNSIQIRAGKLSDAEMAALGGPSGNGIPVATPESSVTGQWDFDQGTLAATVGRALQYFDGPTGLTAGGTQFGTCSSLGVALIDGEDAQIMRVPGDLNRNIGYIMEHLIAPNGGGTRVNQYTLLMDVMVDNAGAGAAALLQISSPDNTDDGDLFWQGDQFGQGAGGYNGTGAFTPLVWHRVIAAYDEAANPPVVTKYVDGIFQDDWTMNQGLDDPRRALLPTAILFADGDQDERRVLWVNSIQIRSGVLSKAEMAALGGPSVRGLPLVVAVPAPPPTASLTIRRTGNTVSILWPVNVTGYTLESTPSLMNPTWTPVSGVSGNCATVAISEGAQFFRLINP